MVSQGMRQAKSKKFCDFVILFSVADWKYANDGSTRNDTEENRAPRKHKTVALAGK